MAVLFGLASARGGTGHRTRPRAVALCVSRGDWHGGFDPLQHKVGIQCTPLTTQLLHAVGVAHAAKLRGEDTVVLAMCGDGATSEGDFHEALNFAAVFHLPVIFFVQNNKYAISVPLAHQSVAPSLAHKAVGCGMAACYKPAQLCSCMRRARMQNPKWVRRA